MKSYSFADHIGGSIYLAFNHPFVNLQGETKFGVGATLLGAEPEGLWVSSEEMDAFFEEALWEEEMKLRGPDAIGKTLESGDFIPFYQLRFVKVVRLRAGEGI